MTVLVGPNNGGKSTALADLQNFSSHGMSSPFRPWPGGTVLSVVDTTAVASQEEALAFLAPRIYREEDGVLSVRSFVATAPPGMSSSSGGVQPIAKEELDTSRHGEAGVTARLLTHSTIALNGRQRFDLATGRQSGELDQPATSHWMAIERDDAIFAEVDRMVSAAFGQHLVMQTFRPPQIEPALSTEPLPATFRHSTAAEAVERQRRATPLSSMSDGVQVFCGLVAAIATLPHLLLPVDEPEAFLHPTLARHLGASLARIARERDARLFAATHSSDFLLGCLDEVPETTVLRLDYRSGVATSHAMTSSDAARLSRDPLLRSAGSLQALFARSAIVCESDSDRAFYEEINRRLLGAEGRKGASDCVFLNAQNWQTTLRLAGPLRGAGVPAAVVVDLDTLAKDDAWADLVAIADLASDDRDRVLAARMAGRDAINACGQVAPSGPLRVKAYGVDALDETQLSTVLTALRELASIGIFVVHVGELERWLSQFGCTNKQTWVTDMLQRLGTRGDGAYVEPGEGDVWEFVEGIAAWLDSPTRAGMPAT